MIHELIIDSDPGIDDAVAILLGMSSLPHFQLTAIVAVAGNVPVDIAAANARKICNLAGNSDVPVYAGCSGPMRRALLTGEDVHGLSGLGSVVLPEADVAIVNEGGVAFLMRLLSAARAGSITIAALGPLTNLGTVLTIAPHLARGVRTVVMMGGAFSEPGNVTAWAEYNVYSDPEAAAAVLKSGVSVTMIPLDVTRAVPLNKARMELIAEIRTKCGTVVAEMLRFYEPRAASSVGDRGAPLHDPCVIAYLACPQLFESDLCEVVIDTTDKATAGRTMKQSSRSSRQVRCLTAIDADGYFDFVVAGLTRLP